MKTLTCIEHGKFALLDKPQPTILDPRDAAVRVTLGSICTSDLHIKGILKQWDGQIQRTTFLALSCIEC